MRLRATPLLVALGLAATTSVASDLPPLDCLKALRSARIARMAEQDAEELERLRRAGELCGDRLEVVLAQIDYDRRIGLDAETHEALHRRVQRLHDSREQIPTAVAEHLIGEPDLDTEVLEAVAASYRRTLEQQQTPPISGLRALAAMLERLGQLEQAVAVQERLIGLERGESSTWAAYRLYTTLERWEDAARVLRLLVERGPLQARLFHPRLVRLLARLGEHDEASRQLALLEQAAASGDAEPLDSSFYLDLAWEFRDAGLDEEAERLFRRALEQPERTGPVLASAIGQRPTSVTEQARLAVLYFYADADERDELLASEQPGNEDPFALYQRGTERLTSGQFEEAYELLARAAPAIGDLEAAWYNLALTAYRLKKWPEAATAYARASTLNPERADAWFFQGMAYVNAGQCARATAALERALALDPSRSLAHYHLANCYLELGDRAAATRHRDAYRAAQGRTEPPG